MRLTFPLHRGAENGGTGGQLLPFKLDRFEHIVEALMFLYWLLRYGLVPLRIVHNLHPDGRIQRLDEAQGDGVGILISVGTDRYRRTTPGTFSNVLFKQLGIDIRYQSERLL